MALKDWFADYPDAENFLYPLLHSANKGVGGNVSFYSNPQFDQLVTNARREQDEAKRTAMYKQADELEFQDADENELLDQKIPRELVHLT